jgi:adenosylhomocysteine nucleosidase
MTSVLILCAMTIERDHIADALAIGDRDASVEVWMGDLGGITISLGLIGIGKVVASFNTTRMIDRHQPDLVLVYGLCGALRPHLDRTALWAVDHCWQHDYGALSRGEFINVEAGKAPIAPYPPPVGHRVRREISDYLTTEHPDILWGSLATGDVFVNDAQVAARLARDAALVDMETAAVAFVCDRLGLPWLALRSPSDGADDDAHLAFETRPVMDAEHARQVLSVIAGLAPRLT